MKNKGFTLIELLVVTAIIGILASILISSLRSAVCKKDPTHEGCDIVEQIEQISKEESSVADKFDRSKTTSIDTTFNPEEVEPTVEQMCGDIPDMENQRACEEEYERNKNLQDCINRYAN